LRNFISQDKILDLKKLILYLSKNIWSLFSYEWLASDLGLKLNDVKKFIFLLEKSYLIFTINPFFTNKKAEYSKKQKIYFNNFWIVNYFTWNLDLKNIIDWKDVEETLFLNLRYNLEFNDNLFFYQKVNGSEIDFILKRNWKITPIEAKLSNKDIIPKIFNSFYEVYSKEIDYFIKSTKNINFTRDFNQTKVLWIPFYNIF
jgi:predicted AAA+ superfamily ATPase